MPRRASPRIPAVPAVRPRRRPAGRKAPDRRRAEAAFRELLAAFGLDLESADFRDSPARAAQAWCEVLLSGYAIDPARVLGRSFATDSRGAVVAAHVPFLSMCPHHLLPLVGEAHVAFFPSGRVPGFGSVARLIDALAHRLVLQEDLTRAIAEALRQQLGAEAAACVLEARHTCVAVTDPARQGVLFRTSAGAGTEERIGLLLAEINSALRNPNPRS